jgi:hypothetical protein
VTEPTEKITLHVPRSTDGETEFARVADILDHLATQYAWEPYVYGFLITRASEARCVDRVYEVKAVPALTLEEVRDHAKHYPRGCEFHCDVCVALGRYK